MGTLLELAVRLHLALVAPRRPRDQRGDVPGWVLVVLMSVALVTAIGAIARPQLEDMLRTALNKVK
jgi:hypothetical protein